MILLRGGTVHVSIRLDISLVPRMIGDNMFHQTAINRQKRTDVTLEKTFDLKGIFRSKVSLLILGNLTTSQWNKKTGPRLSLCRISIGKRILIRSYWTNVFSHVLLHFPMLSSCNETKAKSITVVFLPFCCCCFRVFCYEQVDSFKSEAYERKTKRAF